MAQLGLTKSALQTEVDTKLRMAGITVVDEATLSDGFPTLYVNTTIIEGSEPWVFSVNLEFEQAATLYRNPSLMTAGAITWHAGITGKAGSAKIAEVVGSGVKDLTDKFINAYLAANHESSSPGRGDYETARLVGPRLTAR